MIIIIIIISNLFSMSELNLSLIKSGFRARVTGIGQNLVDSNKVKHLISMGIVKGHIVEVENSNSAGLLLLKMGNSIIGISKDLARQISVKMI